LIFVQAPVYFFFKCHVDHINKPLLPIALIALIHYDGNNNWVSRQGRGRKHSR